MNLVDDPVIADAERHVSRLASFLQPSGRGLPDRLSIAVRILRRSGLSRPVTALAARREISTR